MLDPHGEVSDRHLMNIAYRAARNVWPHSEAEGVANEALVEALRTYDMSEGRNIKGWVAYIARRRAIDASRNWYHFRVKPDDHSRTPVKLIHLPELKNTLWHAQMDPGYNQVENADSIAWVDDLLEEFAEKLAPREQVALKMKFAGATGRAIAQHIGITEGGVCHMFKRIAKKLQDHPKLSVIREGVMI